jgi:hypothetical protein
VERAVSVVVVGAEVAVDVAAAAPAAVALTLPVATVRLASQVLDEQERLHNSRGQTLVYRTKPRLSFQF